MAAGCSWKRANGLFLPQSRGARDKSQGVFQAARKAAFRTALGARCFARVWYKMTGFFLQFVRARSSPKEGTFRET